MSLGNGAVNLGCTDPSNLKNLRGGLNPYFYYLAKCLDRTCLTDHCVRLYTNAVFLAI